MPPEIYYGLGTLVLVGALAWGVHQTRTRDRSLDSTRDRATRDLYQHPESYDHDAELSGKTSGVSIAGPHDPNLTEARQGETSNHMRWVLLASIVLAVVLIGAATYFTR